jgi:hypothetical protein
MTLVLERVDDRWMNGRVRVTDREMREKDFSTTNRWNKKISLSNMSYSY